MTLFTNCLACSWSCFRLWWIPADAPRQAGRWGAAAAAGQGGLAPSGKEAGGRVHEAALTLVAHTARGCICAWLEMLFQLSSFFSGWVFRCRQCAHSPGKGHVNGKLPTSFSERRRGRREHSSSKLRQKLRAASSRASGKPAEILPGEGGKVHGEREREEGDLLLTCTWLWSFVCL